MIRVRRFGSLERYRARAGAGSCATGMARVRDASKHARARCSGTWALRAPWLRNGGVFKFSFKAAIYVAITWTAYYVGEEVV